MIIWSILLLLFIILAVFSEDDEYETRGTVITVVFLALNAGYFLWKREEFLGFWTNLEWVYLIYFGVYAVIGLIFSFYKWFRYVKYYVAKHRVNGDMAVADYVKKHLELGNNYKRVTAWIGWWIPYLLPFCQLPFLKDWWQSPFFLYSPFQ